MPTHTVAQGECLTSIADRYGLYWQTLWNDPGNNSLRERGRHPNTLMPGDVVHIPERKIRDYVRATGQRYTWKVKGIPAKIRMRFQWDDAPRANERYTLTVDGVVTEGTTDGDGRIELTVPPQAASARLRIGEGEREEEYDLGVGHLDPVEELTGVQARLANLGFACPVSGSLDAATRDALRTFQATCRLPVTGEADDATRARLRDAHEPG